MAKVSVALKYLGGIIAICSLISIGYFSWIDQQAFLENKNLIFNSKTLLNSMFIGFLMYVFGVAIKDEINQ